MNKGISLYFGFNFDYKERIKMIKEAGFDCIITNADKFFNKQNGSIRNQVKELKRNGLKPSSLHMRYKSQELKDFFKDTKLGDKLEKNLIKDVKCAHKYGFNCVVVHLDGEANEIGYNRLRRVLKLCKKLNVYLAIENVLWLDTFIKTFENIDDEYLRFCYDCGHNNCFDPEFDYLEKYGDKLICLHLHDNKGKDDEHTLNKYGNIDWDMLAKKLAKCNEVNLDYEMILYTRENETPKEVLDECYKQACELEKMILNYRNK